MKLGVENMLEVYMQDKKRTKDLETQLDTYNTAIGDTVQRIESIRTNAGMCVDTCSIHRNQDEKMTHIFYLGPYTAQVAQRLKELNYAGNALFINSITSSAQQRSRTKPRSNSSPNIKAKQKASQENTSFPDDGMDGMGILILIGGKGYV